MRIKSYFAASVQAAIKLARKEFGDDVTLITSHVASPENRQLGEYEVVFAIEDSEETEDAEDLESVAQPEVAQPEIAKPQVAAAPVIAEPPAAFKNLLREAITARPSAEVTLADKLDQLRTLLVELGIESSLVRALAAIAERCAFSSTAVAAKPPETKAAPQNEITLPPAAAAALKPGYSKAELAFVMSLSGAATNTPGRPNQGAGS